METDDLHSEHKVILASIKEGMDHCIQPKATENKWFKVIFTVKVTQNQCYLQSKTTAGWNGALSVGSQ